MKLHQGISSQNTDQQFSCLPGVYGLISVLYRQGTWDMIDFRADSRLAPSQWEMLLQCNPISHWLATNLESALDLIITVPTDVLAFHSGRPSVDQALAFESCFNINTIFSSITILITKIRRSWDCFIYIMKTSISARQHLYTTMASWFSKCYILYF